MIWQNPIAWLGVASIAIPILIHLLARRVAVHLPFPTLRFVPTDPAVSVTRRRLTELLLLAVRCGVLVAAVAALAQPYVVTAGRGRAINGALARAIVIDASASMSRAGADGRPGLETARDRARALQSDARTSTVIEHPSIDEAIRAASVWLNRRGGRREMVIVSDFQRGAVTAVAIATVPAEVGVHLVPIDVAPGAQTSTPPAIVGDREIVARMSLQPTTTSSTWTSQAAPAHVANTPVILAGSTEQAAMTAAIAAAQTAGVPPGRSERPVVMVFPAAPERAALAGSGQSIDRPWMFDVIDRVRRDALFGAESARRTTASSAAVLASARRVTFRGAETLAIFPDSSDGVHTAALLAAVMRASADPSDVPELETERESADTLRAWAREPTPPAQPRTTAQPGESDGRWFWAASLALIAIEFFMLRRRARRASPAREAYERVA